MLMTCYNMNMEHKYHRGLSTLYSATGKPSHLQNQNSSYYTIFSNSFQYSWVSEEVFTRYSGRMSRILTYHTCFLWHWPKLSENYTSLLEKRWSVSFKKKIPQVTHGRVIIRNWTWRHGSFQTLSFLLVLLVFKTKFLPIRPFQYL